MLRLIFLKFICRIQSGQLLIKLSSFVGQLVAHGLVVVFLCAGNEKVPLVMLVIVFQATFSSSCIFDSYHWAFPE